MAARATASLHRSLGGRRVAASGGSYSTQTPRAEAAEAVEHRRSTERLKRWSEMRQMRNPAKVTGFQCFLRPKLCSWTAGYSPVVAASSNRRIAALQNVACRRMTCRLGRAPWQCGSQTALLLFGRDLPKLGGSPKGPPFFCLRRRPTVRQARALATLGYAD